MLWSILFSVSIFQKKSNTKIMQNVFQHMNFVSVRKAAFIKTYNSI